MRARRELDEAIAWRCNRFASFETERAFDLLDRAIDVLSDLISMASEGRHVFADDIETLSSQVGLLVEVAANFERYVDLKLGDEIDAAHGALVWMNDDSDRYSVAQRMRAAHLCDELDNELDSLESYLVDFGCDEELELHAREIEIVRSRASGLPPRRNTRRLAYSVGRRCQRRQRSSRRARVAARVGARSTGDPDGDGDPEPPGDRARLRAVLGALIEAARAGAIESARERLAWSLALGGRIGGAA